MNMGVGKIGCEIRASTGRVHYALDLVDALLHLVDLVGRATLLACWLTRGERIARSRTSIPSWHLLLNFLNVPPCACVPMEKCHVSLQKHGQQGGREEISATCGRGWCGQ